jgi:outer membrane protein assembly factor BamA
MGFYKELHVALSAIVDGHSEHEDIEYVRHIISYLTWKPQVTITDEMIFNHIFKIYHDRIVETGKPYDHLINLISSVVEKPRRAGITFMLNEFKKHGTHCFLKKRP